MNLLKAPVGEEEEEDKQASKKAPNEHEYCTAALPSLFSLIFICGHEPSAAAIGVTSGQEPPAVVSDVTSGHEPPAALAKSPVGMSYLR